MSIDLIDANDAIDKMISGIKKAKQHRVNPIVFSDDLSEARKDKEVQKSLAAKTSIHSDLSAISAFSDFFIADAIVVEYATDSNYDTIYDLSKAVNIEHDSMHVFKEIVERFYDPATYFPSVSLVENKLELNIEERSIILELLDSAMDDLAIKDIVKNIETIDSANKKIKAIHKSTYQQSFLLRDLHSNLERIDVAQKTNSAEYFIQKIDTFKNLYASMTSGDDTRIFEALSVFDTLNKENHDNPSAVTAIMLTFGMLYNEAKTPEMRQEKIDSVIAHRAQALKEQTKDIDFDAIDKEFELDVNTIVDGIKASDANQKNSSFTDRIKRRSEIKDGEDVAKVNPLALAAAQIKILADKEKQEASSSRRSVPTDISNDREPPSNVIRVKFGA